MLLILFEWMVGMMSLLGIMDLAACEAIKTSVALITTSLAGAVVWLLTLRFRSGQIRILLSHPRRTWVYPNKPQV